MPHADPTLDLSPAQWRTLDERRTRAWIGADIIVKGDVRCARDLTIDGQVDGRIEVGDHALTIGADAVIKANLVAKTITISGAVTGNVTASDRLTLLGSGSIEGNIKAPKFSMTEGAVVRGKVETG